MKKKLLPLGLVALLMLPVFLQAAEPFRSLLVIPARLRMIQLAFDMRSLRQADVVSWQTDGNADTPALFTWTGSTWSPLALEKFHQVSFLKTKPQKVFFLGLDTPKTLTESFELPGIIRFETYDAAQLINNLDAFYAFSSDEWRFLSKRYGFMLRDANDKVRAQNRYACPPPESPVSPRPAPIVFDKNLPPAEVIEAPAAPAPETTPDASKSAE